MEIAHEIFLLHPRVSRPVWLVGCDKSDTLWRWTQHGERFCKQTTQTAASRRPACQGRPSIIWSRSHHTGLLDMVRLDAPCFARKKKISRVATCFCEHKLLAPDSILRLGWQGYFFVSASSCQVSCTCCALGGVGNGSCTILVQF